MLIFSLQIINKIININLWVITSLKAININISGSLINILDKHREIYIIILEIKNTRFFTVFANIVIKIIIY